MRWGRVLVASIASAAIAASSVHAQQGVETAATGGPVAAAPLGIPVGPQIIDVHWSGDRRGEFTILTVLPPAFRRAEGHSGPSAAESVPLRPAPTPLPLI